MVRIYVNRHVIAANKKHGAHAPPISVSRGRQISRAHCVDLTGPARLVYAPDRPLKCGATVWIEAADARIVTRPEKPPGTVPEDRL